MDAWAMVCYSFTKGFAPNDGSDHINNNVRGPDHDDGGGDYIIQIGINKRAKVVDSPWFNI